MTDKSLQRDRQKGAGIPATTRRNRSKTNTAASQDNPGKAVGAMLRVARQQHQLSQQQLAALVEGEGGKISRGAISDIERGRNLPNLEALASLCSVLHLEPVEVLDRVRLATAVPIDLTTLSQEDLRLQAEDYFWAGDYRSSLAVYDAMLQRFTLDPPANPSERTRLQARIEINRAVALRRCGALNASQAAVEKAIDLANGISSLKLDAYLLMTAILSQKGRMSLAKDAVERAVEISRGEEPGIRAKVWTQKGVVLYRSGQFEMARQAHLEALDLAMQAKDQHQMAYIEGNIGECLRELGRRKMARRRLIKAVDLARKCKLLAIEASWLTALGLVSLDDGELKEAENFALAALRIAKPRAHLLTIFRAEWLLHLILTQNTTHTSDQHRISFLRKLYLQISDHAGVREVQEFKEAVLSPATPERHT